MRSTPLSSKHPSPKAIFVAAALAVLAPQETRIAAGAGADSAASAIVVLDASGSMWATLGGKSRIEIARQALGELLRGWDPKVEIGLAAYGHRKKGDCNDIEILAPVAPVDAARLERIVADVQPKGMTPLSAAVRKAAEALRFTERRSSVILISDGIETCNADPCELGAELERLGVDFTVHVVGFDVAKQDVAGLRCLARATGGSYFRAGDAAALRGALRDAGREIAAPPAKAVATAIDTPPPAASLRAPASIVAGTALKVAWSGPGGSADLIGFAPPAAPDVGGHALEVSQGNPLQLVAPGKPGKYELLYVQASPRRALARAPIDVTPPLATLEAVETVTLGRPIEVAWTGPNGPHDFVTVVAPEAPDAAYLGYAETAAGSPARFAVPDRPGTYELRYVVAASNQVLARRTIVALAATVGIEAAESAPAGSRLPVRWTGPNNRGDFITVVAPGDPDHAYKDYFDTGQTAADAGALELPMAAGTYELRYVSGQSNQVLARRSVVVTPVTATLEAPDSGAAGSSVEVRFSGPNNPKDYITVVAPDAPHNAYLDYFSPRDAPSGKRPIKLPDKPGSYELRYVAGGEEVVLARRKIEVR
jgi:Ca-activated chloride channel family protein